MSVDNSVSDAFRKQILSAMQSNNITKSMLAKKLDVNPSYITKLFKGGNNYTLETALKLAKAVDHKLVVTLENA